jgi:hypothetical protein
MITNCKKKINQKVNNFVFCSAFSCSLKPSTHKWGLRSPWQCMQGVQESPQHGHAVRGTSFTRPHSLRQGGQLFGDRNATSSPQTLTLTSLPHPSVASPTIKGWSMS